MTIEEYLKSEISGRKSRQLADGWMMTDHAYEYHEGYIAALEEILSKLPEMEHEVTVREFKEFCKTHEQCSRCSVVDMCRFDCPRIWDVEEMKRRMKYEEERRMKEAKNADKLEEST